MASDSTFKWMEEWNSEIRSEGPPQEVFVPSFPNPWQNQIGGDHYTKLAIQPMEYSVKNNLGPMEHTVIKYTTRHPDKGGREDLEKAIDMLRKMIDHYYST